MRQTIINKSERFLWFLFVFFLFSLVIKTNMGKVGEKLRAYKKEWESMPWAKGWLTKADEKIYFNEAYCKICNKDLRAHRADLEKHAKTLLHQRKLESISSGKQTALTLHFPTNIGHGDKDRDLKLAAYIALHSSVSSIDHLCNLLKELGKGTGFEYFKMHRTKCSSLIKYIIAPCMLSDLIVDVGDMMFSLIVDESTDISNFKYLCLCIKYFSEKFGRLITDYLGIIVLENATADALYQAVIEFFAENKLKLENIIGLGTDGGSNLCGVNHSLYALLKQRYPNLQLIKCISHAIDKSTSKAAIEFPANVEFLCREIYNWFSHSPLRKAIYRRTWETINLGFIDKDGKPKKFHEFVQLSDTRWLVRFLVVNILLEHWLELQTHFHSVVEKEKCMTARLLDQMLHDDVNHLYLKFLKPILFEINRVNKIFQIENVDLNCAVDDLIVLVLLIAKKIMKPSFVEKGIHAVIKAHDNQLAYLMLEQVDFGIEYYQTLTNSKVTREQRMELETRAFAFLKRLFCELAERIPENLKIFEGLKALSPRVCLNQIRPPFKTLPLLSKLIDANKLGIVESQWNKLLTINWESHFDKSILKKSNTFWSKVYLFEDAAENFVFRDLALYSLRLLSLPSSNAVVERVFSVMKIVKTRLRNKMGIPMLDALIRIRCRFYATNSCCTSFTPTPEMFEKFNYRIMYPTKNAEQEETDAEIVEVLNYVESVCISIPEF